MTDLIYREKKKNSPTQYTNVCSHVLFLKQVYHNTYSAFKLYLNK